MATVLRAWRVEDGKLREIAELRPDEQGLVEENLEDWLASEPDAIQDDLLIIGRQVSTASGPLDLLGLTAEGKLVVIELKRDRAPRETVAQAIDYASWIAIQAPDDIRNIAAQYLKRPLEEAFHDKFEQQLPGIQPETPAVLVIASRLDTSTERMIQYLSEQYRMDIDGLLFRYIRIANEEILIRTTVVPEESKVRARESSRVSPETLIATAAQHETTALLSILRRLSEFLTETAAPSYGGSFSYWGFGQMLCGLNVSAAWSAPMGTIDAWISHGSWAEATGLAEESLMDSLRSNFEFVRQWGKLRQMVIRIKSEEEARRFIELLRHWFEGTTSKDTSNDA